MPRKTFHLGPEEEQALIDLIAFYLGLLALIEASPSNPWGVRPPEPSKARCRALNYPCSLGETGCCLVNDPKNGASDSTRSKQ